MRPTPASRSSWAARKLVASRRSLEFTWRNSEQIQGDLIEAVTRLKQEPGGGIGMSGSPSIVRQLLAANLLDELHLLVHPIAVRHGMRLFGDGDPIPLQLLSSETFPSGVLYTVYGPDLDPPIGGYEEAVAALPTPDRSGLQRDAVVVGVGAHALAQAGFVDAVLLGRVLVLAERALRPVGDVRGSHRRARR